MLVKQAYTRENQSHGFETVNNGIKDQNNNIEN